MATKRFKPRRKPSGLANAPIRAKCKSVDGWKDEHTPIWADHPSIPSVERLVCVACGQVLQWRGKA